MKLNNTVKFDKIPSCPESSKRCNLYQRKNDDNEIGIEENTIPSHQNKSQIESNIGFVQLVIPAGLQKDSLDVA